MKKWFLLSAAALFLASTASAAIHTETVTYKHGNATLKSFLAYDDAQTAKRPGVLVVPEWWGLNDYAKKRAEQLAELGYVALAVDVYGDGKITTDPKEAGEWSGLYKNDRGLLRGRMAAAMKTLQKQKEVDNGKIFAIGFCFGGTAALELARSGANLLGTVSFHGGLATPTPADAKNIKGKVLALHGAADPYVKAEEVAAFEDEMEKANVDWHLVVYGHAAHGFSNPGNGTDNSKGMAYNELAATRAWAEMQAFFNEILKK